MPGRCGCFLPALHRRGLVQGLGDGECRLHVTMRRELDTGCPHPLAHNLRGGVRTHHRHRSQRAEARISRRSSRLCEEIVRSGMFVKDRRFRKLRHRSSSRGRPTMPDTLPEPRPVSVCPRQTRLVPGVRGLRGGLRPAFPGSELRQIKPERFRHRRRMEAHDPSLPQGDRDGSGVGPEMDRARGNLEHASQLRCGG